MPSLPNSTWTAVYSDLDSVSNRFHPSHRLGPACGFVGAVCTGEAWVPVIRPDTASDLSMGSLALPFRNIVWRLRHMAADRRGLGHIPVIGSHLGPRP